MGGGGGRGELVRRGGWGRGRVGCGVVGGRGVAIGPCALAPSVTRRREMAPLAEESSKLSPSRAKLREPTTWWLRHDRAAAQAAAVRPTEKTIRGAAAVPRRARQAVVV